MAKLVVDPISEKSLPILDGLHATDREKLTTIIMSTEPVPLKRLLLASIARQTFTAPETTRQLSPTSKLLEELIKLNTYAFDGDDTEEHIGKLLDGAGVSSQRVLLSMSIARFNILKADRKPRRR